MCLFKKDQIKESTYSISLQGQIKDCRCDLVQPQTKNFDKYFESFSHRNEIFQELRQEILCKRLFFLIQSNSTMIQNISHHLKQVNNVQKRIEIERQRIEKIPQFLKQGDSLLAKIFSQQDYKFELVLTENPTKIFYKDRNFEFNILLLDISTQMVRRNLNILNLCLEVCDQNGEWIKFQKQSLIKGKLQTQLYHGKGQFKKLAYKEVTSKLQYQTVNLVIYTKPVLLKYNGQKQSFVHFDLVKPLIISNVTVKAKKCQ